MILVGDWAPGDKHVEMAPVKAVVLANLEGPVLAGAQSHAPAPKAGPNLFCREPPGGAEQYVFSLANNHTMDYGLPGLEATLQLLEQRGQKACGAGMGVAEARLPIVVDDNGVQVGIIACCEAQFGVARPGRPGVAEAGPWIYSAIRDLRQRVDAVLVSLHLALEDSPWPSPYMRDLCRSFIDAGATVVHGHHAHVPQGYEEYGEGVIFYGLGNWAVDPDKWRDYRNGLWSVAAEIDFRSRPVRWRPITLEIRHSQGSDTLLVEESSAEELPLRRAYLERCNRPLDDELLFWGLWQEVALRAFHLYGAEYMCLPMPPGRRHVEEGLSNADPFHLMLWYNMFACESNRQMMATALGVLAGEINDLRTGETRALADEMLPWARSGGA